MKIVFAAAIGACAIGVGCQQKEDPRITQLEARIARLERSVDVVVTNDLPNIKEKFTMTFDTFDTVSGGMKTIQKAIERQTAFDIEMATESSRISQVVSNWIISENARKPARISNASEPQSQLATKGGMPAAVYDSIAASAAEKWPGNFAMQEYEIKNQVKSYKALHP